MTYVLVIIKELLGIIDGTFFIILYVSDRIYECATRLSHAVLFRSRFRTLGRKENVKAELKKYVTGVGRIHTL